MSDVHESRLDEMASKIAILEEEVAGMKKKLRAGRRNARKATGGGKGAKAGKKKKEAADADD